MRTAMNNSTSTLRTQNEFTPQMQEELDRLILNLGEELPSPSVLARLKYLLILKLQGESVPEESDRLRTVLTMISAVERVFNGVEAGAQEAQEAQLSSSGFFSQPSSHPPSRPVPALPSALSASTLRPSVLAQIDQEQQQDDSSHLGSEEQSPLSPDVENFDLLSPPSRPAPTPPSSG